ncbi:hypothetical protein GCM10023220_24490 [Streptomyces ziwulingensis]|uniref:Uncharacterized protein n=1 Tax=Streptomyces ziwulingensis TaxID=1045501 RepID=A0ABP9BK34_9ACTN
MWEARESRAFPCPDRDPPVRPDHGIDRPGVVLLSGTLLAFMSTRGSTRSRIRGGHRARWPSGARTAGTIAREEKARQEKAREEKWEGDQSSGPPDTDSLSDE